eukprot:CAMPEP_0174362868 /NCGR_PEP_ID=MMETSP0811_2-20130205/66570_1 /TAXON_ID=73025 ORGANISM="Eutreptiella gymnastica-like, Strain CCMP1594" /NCGR_SAMPLE_ID=MMETSP0811_2 /ASSEMBLY_ACC=CAM_ASM_000667 /LENGTH=120 /DNA_ID=CAMNT_0015501037 /DNA_START=12 /DNA_END=370 /DNA_ORIENTATION=-
MSCQHDHGHGMGHHPDWGSEVHDGIYMRDNRPNGMGPHTYNRELDPRLIPDEIKRLQRVIEKLEESNAELQAALQEDPTEQEFKIAVEENLVVIARTKCKIRELEKRTPCKCSPAADDDG